MSQRRATTTQPKRTHKPPSKRDKEKRGWYLSSLDLLGGSFDFSLPTITKKYQTKLGSLLTIFVMVCSVLLFILLFSQFMDTSNPVVTQSTNSSPEPMTLNFFKDMMVNPIGFAYLRQYRPSVLLQKFITVKGFIVEKTFIRQTNRFEFTSIQEFGYKPCAQYENDESYRSFRKDERSPGVESLLLCPDLEKTPELAEVLSNPSGMNSKTLYIKIYPCSLPDKTQCEQNFKPNFASIDLGMAKWVLKPRNYTDPLRFKPLYPRFSLDSHGRTTHSYEIRKHQIIDSLNEFKGDKVRKEYLSATATGVDEVSRDGSQFYCQASDISFLSKTCDEYLTIHSVGLSEVFVVRRNYKKITELLGEFGGILKIASVLFIFYLVYNAKDKELMLAEKVFGYKKQKVSKVGIMGRTKAAKRYLEHPKNELKGLEGLRMKDVSLKSVRDSLNVTNFMKKMNFVDCLELIFLDKAQEPLLTLVDLKNKSKILQKIQQEEEKRNSSRREAIKLTFQGVEDPANHLEAEIKFLIKSKLQGEQPELSSAKPASINQIKQMEGSRRKESSFSSNNNSSAMIFIEEKEEDNFSELKSSDRSAGQGRKLSKFRPMGDFVKDEDEFSKPKSSERSAGQGRKDSQNSDRMRKHSKFRPMAEHMRGKVKNSNSSRRSISIKGGSRRSIFGSNRRFKMRGNTPFSMKLKPRGSITSGRSHLLSKRDSERSRAD